MAQEDEDRFVVSDEFNGFFLSLVVPKQDVKKIKQALEDYSLLDKSLKIYPFNQAEKDDSPVARHHIEIDRAVKKLKVTHIAINKPIPTLVPSTSANSDCEVSNVLRSPTDLMPLHGDFGEPRLTPTEENFCNAFWVSTVQNDITQEWAPMYTMFSRGNIREKTRLLRLLSSAPAPNNRSLAGASSEFTAIDLYAGIGYFAFSYAKAGACRVLCWELNRWSIEGSRRGAKRNGWTTRVVENKQRWGTVGNSDQNVIGNADERLLIFHESNSHAPERVKVLRHKIPRVRHVNCGYLPSSSESWDVAVQVLDPKEGGWIHAHENVATQDTDRRKNEVVEIFRGLVEHYHTAGSETYRFNVDCQHVGRVKAYAPGVIHCVFDVSVLPDKPWAP
ncbi:MAG: hypothetical protein Q9166_002695 [cf. Caloplaca sp. 2 TL-2023]